MTGERTGVGTRARHTLPGYSESPLRSRERLQTPSHYRKGCVARLPGWIGLVDCNRSGSLAGADDGHTSLPTYLASESARFGARIRAC